MNTKIREDVWMLQDFVPASYAELISIDPKAILSFAAQYEGLEQWVVRGPVFEVGHVQRETRRLWFSTAARKGQGYAIVSPNATRELCGRDNLVMKRDENWKLRLSEINEENLPVLSGLGQAPLKDETKETLLKLFTRSYNVNQFFTIDALKRAWFNGMVHSQNLDELSELDGPFLKTLYEDVFEESLRNMIFHAGFEKPIGKLVRNCLTGDELQALETERDNEFLDEICTRISERISLEKRKPSPPRSTEVILSIGEVSERIRSFEQKLLIIKPEEKYIECKKYAEEVIAKTKSSVSRSTVLIGVIASSNNPSYAACVFKSSGDVVGIRCKEAKHVEYLKSVMGRDIAILVTRYNKKNALFHSQVSNLEEILSANKDAETCRQDWLNGQKEIERRQGLPLRDRLVMIKEGMEQEDFDWFQNSLMKQIEVPHEE